MNNVTRVPASKFRREMKKWLRYVEEHEMIVITQRNGPDLVCVRVPSMIKGLKADFLGVNNNGILDDDLYEMFRERLSV